MSSFFKIVQTSENGKLQLVTVPSAWESEEQLRWPTKMRATCFNAMVRDASSVPAEEWQFVQCRLKRTNIASYTEAEKLLSAMSQESDSSSTEMLPPMAFSRKRKLEARAHIGRTKALDFSTMVWPFIVIFVCVI